LILLCQWHHTAVHEGGVTITRDPDGWVFSKPDGQTCQPWVSDENLARHLDFALRKRQQAHLDQLAGCGQLPAFRRTHHPSPLGW
jgi:hypothetical protein